MRHERDALLGLLVAIHMPRVARVLRVGRLVGPGDIAPLRLLGELGARRHDARQEATQTHAQSRAFDRPGPSMPSGERRDPLRHRVENRRGQQAHNLFLSPLPTHTETKKRREKERERERESEREMRQERQPYRSSRGGREPSHPSCRASWSTPAVPQRRRAWNGGEATCIARSPCCAAWRTAAGPDVGTSPRPGPSPAPQHAASSSSTRHTSDNR